MKDESPVRPRTHREMMRPSAWPRLVHRPGCLDLCSGNLASPIIDDKTGQFGGGRQLKREQGKVDRVFRYSDLARAVKRPGVSRGNKAGQDRRDARRHIARVCAVVSGCHCAGLVECDGNSNARNWLLGSLLANDAAHPNRGFQGQHDLGGFSCLDVQQSVGVGKPGEVEARNRPYGGWTDHDFGNVETAVFIGRDRAGVGSLRLFAGRAEVPNPQRAMAHYRGIADEAPCEPSDRGEARQLSLRRRAFRGRN